MKLMAHLLAESAIDAVCLIDYGIEESLAVGLHGDAVLGTAVETGTACCAIPLPLSFINLSTFIMFVLYHLNLRFHYHYQNGRNHE